MKKDPKVFIGHIVDCINEIEKNTAGLSYKDFFKSTLVQDAVIRRLEIIGEASKNISESFRNDHNAIPWDKMSAMRNILIHEYFGVDLGLVWQVVQKDLPKIKDLIEKLL